MGHGTWIGARRCLSESLDCLARHPTRRDLGVYYTPRARYDERTEYEDEQTEEEGLDPAHLTFLTLT
jgi:hypothetical protein